MADELITLLRFLLGYTKLLTLPAGILTWEACTKSHLSAEIKWSLYAGGFLAASFMNWRAAIRKADDAESALRQEKRTVQTERVFAQEPAFLLERFGDILKLTDTRVLSYLDKWIAVSGRFEGTAESLVGDGIHVSLLLESGRRVPLRFPNESRNRLQSLREGQRLTAVCQVLPSYEGVLLGNAELVRA